MISNGRGQPGKLYDLVPSTDLADPIAEWPVYDPDGEGGIPPYANIPADGEASTTINAATDALIATIKPVTATLPPVRIGPPSARSTSPPPTTPTSISSSVTTAPTPNSSASTSTMSK